MENSNKKPFILEGDKVVSFDVDDTLVMWESFSRSNLSEKEANQKTIKEFTCFGKPVYLRPHFKHIQKLKGYRRSGYKVIIWSMGGWEWALEVATKLDLLDHVDLVLGKPNYLYDDMPLSQAFGERKYFIQKDFKDDQD